MVRYLAILILLGTVSPVPGAVTFVDRTEALGLTGGGGAACWTDLNNDDWVDLVFNGGIWRNNGGTNFTRIGGFPDCVSADINNDGFADLFSGGSRRVYLNQGGTNFVDFPLPPLPDSSSISSALGDWNGDGFLDVYIGGYESWPDVTWPDMILTNNQGVAFGLAWSGTAGRARGVTTCDFDQDGDLDIYVSNYRLQPNLLFLNLDGAGFFENRAPEYNAVATDPGFGGGHSIGACWGDFNADGLMDLFAGNFAHDDNRGDQPESRFLINRGPGANHYFDDIGKRGVYYQESYASPAAGDYDNDGDLDLFFTTVYGVASFGRPNFPVMFDNDGNLNFSDVKDAIGLAGLPPTYQAAFADFDNDGDLDLMTAGGLKVNEGGNNHWLKVELVGDGTRINRSAVGGQVRVLLPDRTLTRHVEAGTGQANQNELTLHFGLGQHNAPVDLEVFWPNGVTETIPDVAINQRLTIHRNTFQLIKKKSSWKFNDTGLNLGSDWQLPTYDDDAWPSGPAPLGFGDGDEATLVSSNRQITTYFRHTFLASGPGTFTNLNISVLRDDGAVVYLNGQEVFRTNIDPGPVNYLTLADTADSLAGDETTTFYGTTIDPDLLIDGSNVIAVEIHQSSRESSDISFDFQMVGQAPPNRPLLRISNGPGMSAYDVRFPVARVYGEVLQINGAPPTVTIFWGETDGGTDPAAWDHKRVVGTRQKGPFEEDLTGFAGSTDYFYRCHAGNNLGSAWAPGSESFRTPDPTLITLIPAGAEWHYSDIGLASSYIWKSLSMNDALWQSGPAQLGYGDGDEATTIGYGPDPENKFITTYFRHKFVVPDPTGIGGLRYRLIRDDGAMVYLNTVETIRDNLPEGVVAFETPALNTVGPPDESAWWDFKRDAAGLVAGTNIVAVELHQATTNSSDISFDLELVGEVFSRAASLAIDGDAATNVRFTSADLQGSLQAINGEPAHVFVYWGTRDGGTDPDGWEHRQDFGLQGDGPLEVTLTSLFAGTDFHFRFHTSNGLYNAWATNSGKLTTVAGGQVSLIAPGSVWKYSDRGISSGFFWRLPALNDGNWASGPAQLGYGDGDESTVISFGNDPLNKYITTYFRHAFHVADATVIDALQVRLIRDDGAVLYLNGDEILRSNMPEGDIAFDTLASASTRQETEWLRFGASATHLVTGTNLLAVEVHQATPTSSDLSFDLELFGITHVAHTVPLALSANSTSVSLQWPDDGIRYIVQTTTSIDSPVTWINIPFPPTLVDDTWRITLPNAPVGTRFFRLLAE